MYKRQGLLDKLIQKYPEDNLLRELIDVILKYYEMDGFVNLIPHYKIFKALYSDGEIPIWKIAMKNYLHRDTIKKYIRQNYNVIVKNMIEADYIPGIKNLFWKEVSSY